MMLSDDPGGCLDHGFGEVRKGTGSAFVFVTYCYINLTTNGVAYTIFS